MNLDVSRRSFLKMAGTGVAGSALGAFGFTAAEAMTAAHVRPFKLASAAETRSTCPYCSVACGTIMYTRADSGKGEKAEIIHVEGDADNPVSRGTLCPRGAAILDFVKAETRVTQPRHRKPGSDKFEPVTWDFAIDRIARLMKADRDANFVATNKDGVTVNRWPTFAAFVTSSMTNEGGYLGAKLFRSAGVIALENQARI